MRRLVVVWCVVMYGLSVAGQRSYPFDVSERLFAEGKELYALKNYSGCIDKLTAYKREVAGGGRSMEAEYLLASALYWQGVAGAIEGLKGYLEAYPDSPYSDEVCFYIGSAHFGKAEYERAVYWLETADIDRLSEESQGDYAYRLAYSLLQLGRGKEARAYFAELREASAVYRDAASYYVAYLDYSSGNYNQALAGFTPLKSLPDYTESAQYYLAQIYFIQGKYERSAVESDALLATYPNGGNNRELYRIAGNSYYHLHDTERAIARLTEYASATETPLRGDLYILGICHYNRGDYGNAIKYLRPVTVVYDALGQSAYLYLGQSYLKMEDKANARMSFERAAMAPYDAMVKEAATYNYALLIHETAFTGFGESVNVFEKFLNDFPGSQYADKVNDYLVEVYLTTRNYEAALASIEKINHPSSRILEAKQDILFQLGTQSYANMETEAAVSLFTRAINMGVYNAESRNNAYYWRGESYYRQELYQNALSDYGTYLNNTRRRDTDMYPLAHYNSGYCYFKQQRYDEALKSFRQYVELEGNKQAEAYSDAYCRIGDCLFYNRRFSEAGESYTQAAALQPSAADYALFQKGYVLGLQKDYKGKIAAMERIISNFPDSRYTPDALYEKGRSYVLLNNNLSAADAFETLVRRFPQSSQARKGGVQLGLLYYNSNQPQKAVAAYKKVIDNYPGSDEARVALEDLKSVYIDLNDIDAYATYANSLGGNVRIQPSEQDSLTYIAAERLFMRNDYEGARRSFANYLQIFPSGAFSTSAHFYLASIAFHDKNYGEAKRLFTQVLSVGDTKFAEESWARKAEIEYMEKDYKSALVSFKRLQVVAEDASNREAAGLGIMRCAYYSGQLQDALAGAGSVLKGTKLSPEVIAEARYIRAKAHIDLNQPNLALTDLMELGKDTRIVYGAEAKYLLAQVYYDAGELPKAEKELMSFIERGTPHQYWLARGFILLADIYIRQGDHFQARQYLANLKDNYKGDDDIAAMIESRLSQLTN